MAIDEMEKYDNGYRDAQSGRTKQSKEDLYLKGYEAGKKDNGGKAANSSFQSGAARATAEITNKMSAAGVRVGNVELPTLTTKRAVEAWVAANPKRKIVSQRQKAAGNTGYVTEVELVDEHGATSKVQTN